MEARVSFGDLLQDSLSEFAATTNAALPYSFESLISPFSTPEFCTHYWGQRFLHVARGKADYYSSLVSFSDIEQCLATNALFQRDSVATPFRTDGMPEAEPQCASEVFDRLAQGKPLRLRRMETIMSPDSPVIAMLRDMEQKLQQPLSSLSCYISPASEFGLGPHHDESEIFTLQISGAKTWRLFNKVTSDEPGLYENDGLGDPDHEITLKAGDLLYVPSGLIHDVTVAESEASFSLTIVFEPFRWTAMLDLLLARLGRSDLFSKPVLAGPRHGADAFDRAFDERVAAIRQELANLTGDDLADVLTWRHLAGITLPPAERISSILKVGEINLGTLVSMLPGITWNLTREDDRVRLVLPGGYSLFASPAVEPALRSILSAQNQFLVSDMSNSLSAPAKIALAKRLVGCGLLRLIPAN
jgi:ribosomal protein L16 Arg81 hydroxylase